MEFDTLTDFTNLYRAHLDCRRGKRWKDSVAIYDMRALECTLALQKLLLSGEYKISPYNCFTINERGKERQIKSIKYHDRVVQKCLMDEILTPLVVPTFINTNAASIKGKGTDYAMQMLKSHMRQFYNKHGGGYILACDMHHYFDTIPHDYIVRYFEERIEDERITALIKHIIESIPGGRGLPLGNQLSQLAALIMLNEMDHYIKEHLHIRWYGRYNDDFYLIDKDKEKLKQCKEWVKNYVEGYGMKLNTKKTKIVKTTQGINYLGFRFYQSNTGRIVQRLAKKSIKSQKKRLKKMKKLYDNGEISKEAILQSYNGWRAHASRGDTYYLLRKMDKTVSDLFKEVNNENIEPAPGGSSGERHRNKIQQQNNHMASAGARA